MAYQLQLITPEELTGDPEVLYALLSPDEAAHIRRIRQESKRNLRLLTHHRLRLLAADKAGLPPKALTWTRQDKGKPAYPECPGIHFSLSYTDTAAVIALSDSPIGVDIERIRPRTLHLGPALGTPQELCYLEKHPDDPAVFYDFWTKKEAYIKFLGCGLSMALSSFSVYESPVADRLTTQFRGDLCITVCL